jgi:hypothetical protein
MILAAVDPSGIGLEALITLDRHASGGQLVNGLVDVVHREVEDRERRRRFLGWGLDRSGGGLLAELVGQLADLGLWVAAMPAERPQEGQPALLGPAGHGLG